MTADTTTPLLKLLLQGTGNNPNAWGDNLNNQVITPLEQSIAGLITINSTGGTVTLTDEQARNAMLNFTGAKTSALTIVVPASSKIYKMLNNTTGNFPTFVQYPSGNKVNLPPGITTEIICTGGVVGRVGAERIGNMFYHAGLTAPAGSIECTGAAVSRADLVDLYGKIGTTWGAGDGFSTFNLPGGTDTGRFLRSRIGATAPGSYQSNQNKLHTHTASGTTSGESVGHTHSVSGATSTESVDHTHTGSGLTSNETSDHYHSGSGSTGGMSANASHSHSSSTGKSFVTGNTLGTSGVQGGSPYNIVPDANLGSINAVNLDHTHAYSFATTGVSAFHSHNYAFTTSGRSAAHTHNFSAVSSGISADHTHTYSFTTSSDGGNESRPEAMTAILCIWF